METKENTTLNNLLDKAQKVRQEIVNHLYDKRREFVFKHVGEHYVVYSLGDWLVNVWIANGENHAGFYGDIGGLKLDDDNCYTYEMRAELWKMARKSIEQKGKKRRIEKTQMRNDLYFTFKGVHTYVKFTGYDDDNWWENKPTEIKEDENITWSIDWENMEAVYKPINK